MVSFFPSKLGIELTLNTVIIAILVLVVLILMILVLVQYGSPLLDVLHQRVNSTIALTQSVQVKP